MQIAQSFCHETVQKIKKSALIAGGGFLIAVVPVLLNDPTVVSFLQAHPVASLAVGSFVPFIVNTVKEWLSGQE